MGETYIDIISGAISAARRKRAAGLSVINDAIYLAKDTETSLGNLAGIYGADSDRMKEMATVVAAEMLNIIISALNRQSSDKRHDLKDARKALTYISRLPVSGSFAETRLTPQRSLIINMMRGYSVADCDSDIEYRPTVGDDAFFSACVSADDFSQYLRRHPRGRHTDEANRSIRHLEASHKRRLELVRIAMQLSGILFAVMLLVAVCVITGLSTGITTGLSLLLAGAGAGLMFIQSYGADRTILPGQRQASAIAAILFLIAGSVIIFTTDRRAQRAELDYILAHSDEDALVSYLCDPHNTYYADEALSGYLAIMDSVFFDPARMSKPSQVPPLARMANLAKADELPVSTRGILEERVRLRTDSLYRISLAANDLDTWLSYQALAPSDLYYDSSERIDSIETVNWGSEPTAWTSATEQDTRDGYTRYLDMYPGGAHAAMANARLIDLEVKDYRNQGQVNVESISRIADNGGEGSRVCIYNNSDYDVKFMFSGPASVSYTVAARGYDEHDFADGTYQVLALIDNPQRDRFSFLQNLDNGIYSSTIEINDKVAGDDQ